MTKRPMVEPHRQVTPAPSGAIVVGPTDRVFVLTGAGISAESGIRTFRDSNGLWEEHRVEDVASPEGWRRDPELVWRFYSQRRQQAASCRPNLAHRELAELGDRLDDRLFVCTQNVDGLHEEAGSKRVVHMHGELFKSRCDAPTCRRPSFVDTGVYLSRAAIPRCPCGGSYRPDIVWFGEIPFELDRIRSELDACTIFVTVGSSGAVYPAAAFVEAVDRRGGVRKVYVGPEPPDNARSFDEVRLGKAGDTLPGLFVVTPPPG